MRRRRTTIFFLILGICLLAITVALNVSWILLNVREVALLIIGIVLFALILTGLTLNTIFLLREIQRNEQHDAFLNAVTHELKTPIASIKLYLDTLRTRDLEPEKRREFYEIMHADNERLLATVQQVLLASRTREKGRRLDRDELDLADAVSEAIEMVRSRRNLDDGCIRLTTPKERVIILGDPRELQTVFTNLLENAVKYSPDEVRVSVRLVASSAKYAEVYVRDNGIGIARGDLKRVFKRFYRSKNVRSAPAVKGTGLGLSIVRAIVEKHGGRVTAESRGEGRGSTFRVRLPRPR
ncbi:MAG: HAMP domain-containing histidine kinase [Acidobacteria bacterium]|nr:HAMP domain-containing histidine kinase [Acidobacteriota bacterium]